MLRTSLGYTSWRNTGTMICSFFKHENQHHPPSLSDYGKLRCVTKSDLLHILEHFRQQDPPSSFDVVAYDGAALVHFLPTKHTTTFDEYASSVFCLT